MNKMKETGITKNSQDHVTLSNHSISSFDSNTTFETIPEILDAIKNSIEVFKKLEKAYYSEKVKWRDNVIKNEKSLIEVMNIVKDASNKKLMAEGLVEFSEKILQTAQEDLTATKSDNPFVNLMNYWIRKFDLDGKRKFWLETFDMQNDLMVNLLKSDIDKETEYKTCKMIIKYCDLLICGVDKLRYKSQNPTVVQDDYISHFDDISKEHIDGKLLETKSIRDDAVNRIKKLRDFSDRDKTNVVKDKQKINDKMLGIGESKKLKKLDLVK